MALKLLTGADAVLMLAVINLFDQAQQIQGFAADESTEAGAMKVGETLRGLDGKLSGGFVYVDVVQTITLQSDSDSCDFFDIWNSTEQATKTKYISNGTLLLPQLFSQWTLTKGFLTSFTPFGGVKKLVQPRKFEITWETGIRSAV